jgi:hypothetical protein
LRRIARVKRIDTKTASSSPRLPAGSPTTEGELNVVAGAGSIWVASDAKGVVARIDPATNAVVATVPVDPGTWYMAFGDARSGWSAPRSRACSASIRDQCRDRAHRLGKRPASWPPGKAASGCRNRAMARWPASIRPAALAGRVKVGANLKWGDIDTGAGKVWLRTTDDQVFAVIDAETMAIKARGASRREAAACASAQGHLDLRP